MLAVGVRAHRQLGDHAHRCGDPGLEQRRVGIHDLGGDPAVRREAGCVDVGGEAQIGHGAVVDAGGADGAEPARPGRVGDERDLAVDLELRDGADAVAVDRGAPREAEAAAIPALAHGEHDDVLALVQERR